MLHENRAHVTNTSALLWGPPSLLCNYLTILKYNFPYDVNNLDIVLYGSQYQHYLYSNKRLQELITRSIHLPYKPLESTLCDEKLFIEIVFAETLSRPGAHCHDLMLNNQSTNQSAAQSSSFTCTFFCSEEPLTTMAESVQGNLSESWNNVFSRESLS